MLAYNLYTICRPNATFQKINKPGRKLKCLDIETKLNLNVQP